MGAQPDVRLTWSFLHAIASLWASHPGTYKVADQADDLVPALAQMCVRAFASEVRESVPRPQQDVEVAGELTLRTGERRDVTLRDIANKVTHGSAERIVVRDEGDIRMYFVNSPSEVESKSDWTEMWFSAVELIEILHGVLYIKPHDSSARDQSIQSFISRLGKSRFLPMPVSDTEGDS